MSNAGDKLSAVAHTLSDIIVKMGWWSVSR